MKGEDEDDDLPPLKPFRDPEDNFKIYNAIWQNMDRENNLIHFRITWAMVLGAAVLTAESFMAGRVFPDAATSQSNGTRLLFCAIMVILSVSAAYFSYKTREGVLAAQTQMKYLRKHYYRFGDHNTNHFQQVMLLPRPFGDPKSHVTGDVTARKFPFMMVSIWGAFTLFQAIGSIYFIILLLQQAGLVPLPLLHHA